MVRPEKPYPDFPLMARKDGRWAKKIHQKWHYFGWWKKGVTADIALKNYLERKDALESLPRRLREPRVPASYHARVVMRLENRIEHLKGEVKRLEQLANGSDACLAAAIEHLIEHESQGSPELLSLFPVPLPRRK